MMMKPIAVRAALIAVTALILSACGSTTQDSSDSPESADQTRLGGNGELAFANSHPLPNCAGQDPSSCTYVGFDPAVDGFSFENWGSEPGNLGASDLIALFGRKKVCASGSGSECVLYPAAKQWVEQINEALAGGRCEGMAVTSELIHGGYLDPSDFDPNATNTFDLTKDNPAVTSTIEYFWATQAVAPVQQAYQRYQKYQPSRIAAELVKGLQNGAGYTLGIYSPAGGHAVTPFAVTDEGDLIAIHVYDNNYPGTVQRIMIDPDSESWSYAMGSTNPQAPTGGWEGGIGTIELTPMVSRLGTPFPAPFEDKRRGAKTSQLMLTSPDPDAGLGVLLTIGDTVYDTRDANVALPEGVSVRSIRGTEAVLGGNWLSMTIDREIVGGFEAAVAQQNEQAASIPITMSVDDPTSPRTTVRAAHNDQSDVFFGVSPNGAVDVAATNQANAEINVANGLNSANFDLPEGVSMRVDSRDADGVSDITYFDSEDGEVIGEYPLDEESDSGFVTEIDAEFQPGEDGELGDFDVTEERVEAEEIDEDFIDSVEEPFDPASELGDDDSGAEDSGSGDAGADDSGADDSGAEDLGSGDAGADDSGAEDSGAEDPGSEDLE